MRDPFNWPYLAVPPKRAPEPPAGYALVVDENGDYLRGPDGRYLTYPEA
jgi:hypothetical protein